MSLVLCSNCSRHIRRTEAACPFCDALISSAVARSGERTLPTARLSRAALLAFATATACGGTTVTPSSKKDPEPDGGVAGAGGITGAGGAFGTGGFISAPPYGIPPGTGGFGAAGSGSGGAYMGTGGYPVVPPYGVPPFGSGGGPALDCVDLLSGGTPARCCPDPLPDCTGKPNGYPGYYCTPPPSSYCSCACQGGSWVCAC